MKRLLSGWLTSLAQAVIRKYDPDIIGITGSVGKTTTKEAIAAVLAPDMRLRKSAKNYNNELGVPLTILGVPAPGRSPFAWLRTFVLGFRLLLWTDSQYPRVLVLEMAADRPGDIQRLVRLFPCRVGVVTAIGPAHQEFFASLERIAEEKAAMVRRLTAEGFAVLNGDDPRVAAMAEGLSAPVAFYGFSKKAEVRAGEPRLVLKERPGAADAIHGIPLPVLETRVSYGGKSVTLRLPNVVGRSTVRALLAAVTVGIAYDVSFEEALRRLQDFTPPAGRLRLMRGSHRSLILDDTYNASPPAVLEALDTLRNIPGAARRIAALGEMAELGDAAPEGYRQVGKAVAKTCHMLVTVGEAAKAVAKSANEAGMHANQLFSFPSALEAGDFLSRHINYGDAVLVKGSQVSRMERAVKKVMAEPMRASELLVRQGKEWSKKYS